MDAEYIERYIKLRDINIGDIAVSKDRKHLFARCRFRSEFSVKDGIVDLKKISDQYVDRIDMEQPVKVIQNGDKFVLTI